MSKVCSAVTFCFAVTVVHCGPLQGSTYKNHIELILKFLKYSHLGIIRRIKKYWSLCQMTGALLSNSFGILGDQREFRECCLRWLLPVFIFLMVCYFEKI